MSVCVFGTAELAAQTSDPAELDTVASASLCADAYVLALFEPDDVTALSWQVDQSVSVAPDWARERPQAWPDAEHLLTLSADLVVFGSGEAGRAGRIIDRTGRRYIELQWGESFDTVRTNFRALGVMAGREHAAATASNDLDRRMADLSERARRRAHAPGLVYLSASGGSAGAGTYVDAAIQAAGGRNLLADAGITGWTRADPELALRWDADIVLTSFFTDGFASVFNRGSRHAAYRHLLDGAQRVDIPAGYWPCAGPHLIEAAEMIADALDAWERDE